MMDEPSKRPGQWLIEPRCFCSKSFCLTTFHGYASDRFQDKQTSRSCKPSPRICLKVLVASLSWLHSPHSPPYSNMKHIYFTEIFIIVLLYRMKTQYFEILIDIIVLLNTFPIHYQYLHDHLIAGDQITTEITSNTNNIYFFNQRHWLFLVWSNAQYYWRLNI